MANRFFNSLLGSSSASLLLDSISDVPIGAYSMRKLRVAYAGACIRVRKVSNSAEQDIGFTALGWVDTAAMVTFAGASSLQIVKWYDQSTTAGHLIEMIPNSAVPAYNYFLSTRPGIDFGNAVHSDAGLRAAGSTTVSAPKVFIAANPTTTDTGWKSTNTSYYCDFGGNKFTVQAGHGSLFLYNGVSANCGRDDGGRKQRTAWFKTGNDKCIIDGTDRNPSPYAPSFLNAGDNPQTGQFAIGNNPSLGGPYNFQGVFGEVLVFDGAVNASAVIQASQSAAFIGDGLPTNTLSYTKRVTLEGDSRTYGFNTVMNPDTQSWALRLQSLLDSSWSIRNVATSAQRLIGDYDVEAAYEIDPYYNASLLKNVEVVWGIVNDLHFNPTLQATALYNAMVAYVDARQVVGFTVIVCTDPDTDAANGYITADAKIQYNAYNAALRANHSFADGFVDLNLVPELADATNTTYFDDGTHLTLAGANKVADAVYPVLNTI